MKCIHCNYEIDNNTNFCPNCGKPKTQSMDTTTIQNLQNSEITKKYGFSNALTSTILGACSCFSLILSCITLFFTPSTSTVFAIAGLITSIIGIIKGVKGIKDFIYAKNTAHIKPVATLVLGICGVATAGFAIFYGFFFMFFTIMII